MSDTTDFAALLRQLREKAGLSQYALAKLAGIGRQIVSQLESGRNKPTWETVQKLALALGVTCEALADPQIKLPQAQPEPRRGRPKKAPAEKKGKTIKRKE